MVGRVRVMLWLDAESGAGDIGRVPFADIARSLAGQRIGREKLDARLGAPDFHHPAAVRLMALFLMATLRPFSLESVATPVPSWIEQPKAPGSKTLYNNYHNRNK